MVKNDKKLIAVVGPTGSGKTSLGVKLAKEFDGEIVSADSRQVFRGLDIGTGKDLDDLEGVKYHMIDVRNPGDKFTLFDWLKEARKIVDEMFKRGKVPVIVGGTGLYIQGLIEGFQISKDTRNKDTNKLKIKREKLDNKSIDELLSTCDEANIDVGNIDSKNPRRLIRAIEKNQGGETPTKKKPDFESILIGPKWSRDELNAHIDKRLDQRFSEGMLEETKDLIKDGVDQKWLVSLGLDYKVMTEYLIDIRHTSGGIHRLPSVTQDDNPKKLKSYKLKANMAFEAMKQDLKTKEHQYAKRQLTWWNRFDVRWTEDYSEAKRLVADFLLK